MTDLVPEDIRFEQRIREVFADLAPAAAPASLRAAVAGVPGRRVGQAPGKVRLLVAAMGIAAAVVIAIAGIGLLGGRLPIGPAIAPPTGGVPSAAPSPSPTAVTLTFDVTTPDGSMATKAQTDAVGSVMQERLRDYGIGTFSSSYSDDQITFEMALPDASPASVAAVRDLLGATGAFSIGLAGTTAPEPGDRVEGSPLFTGDAVTAARLAASGSGGPTLYLALDAPAAAALADATRGHVGEYLVIALDGMAVAAPMINEEIVDGGMQISFGGDDPKAARLAAILQAGQLPLPVEPVTP